MSVNLSLKPYGLKFVSTASELAYKAWRDPQLVPLLRVVAVASLLVWVVFPIWGHLSWSIDYLTGYRPYIVGSFIPVFFLAVFVHRTPLRRWPVLIFCLGNSYIGFMSVIALFLWELETVGGAVGVAIIYNLWMPFMRIPPIPAMVAMSAYMAPLAAELMQAFERRDISAADGWGYMGCVVATYVIVAVTAVAIERFSRRAFIKEQLLAQQQSLLEVQQLQTLHTQSLIRRYVPPAVANQIIEGNEAEISEPRRQRVTVMFSDIVGFTDIADRVEPEVMTQVLSEYMSSMAGLIESHGGTLNEFAGDGLMALFGAPNAMEPEVQARSAVIAAMAMQQRMPELNEQWRKLGLGTELKVRMGINTGMVSVGSFGSEGRMTYTAIGLQTNIASRIESKAAPGEILISDASYQLICEQIECELRGEVECKGVHFPVKVYAPSLG